MSLLTCEALTRAPWFSGLELALEPGEIVVVRGPSGCGKSLLLRSIADLDPVDSGSLRLDGVERGSMRAADWRRQVLYVHQRGVRLAGTVAQNVSRITALAAIEAAATPVPGLVPASDAGLLSGGEAQRLALHRALLCAPRVLLLDEATSALDAQAAREHEERLLAFVAEGHAILWASHDGALAERLGARELRPW